MTTIYSLQTNVFQPWGSSWMKESFYWSFCPMVFMYICTVNGVTCIDRVASKDWLLIQSWPCVTPTINFSQFHLIKLHTSQPTDANHDEQDKTLRCAVQSLFPSKSHSWNPESRPKKYVWLGHLVIFQHNSEYYWQGMGVLRNVPVISTAKRCS